MSKIDNVRVLLWKDLVGASVPCKLQLLQHTGRTQCARHDSSEQQNIDAKERDKIKKTNTFVEAKNKVLLRSKTGGKFQQMV